MRELMAGCWLLAARRPWLLLGVMLLSLTAGAQTGSPAPAALPTPAEQSADKVTPRKRPKRILNDSTQVLYGPRTTKLLYEADALAGQPRRLAFDTAFHQMWNQRNWYHDTTWQQDLGNVGTPSRPLLWPVGQPVGGIRWGRWALDRYVYDLPSIPYYDARSPYSHLHYIQGARGEQVFEARYTRNARRALNVGGSYQRLSANAQLLRNASNTKDNYLTHSAPVVWGTYETRDSVYRVFATYGHVYHEVLESGGLAPASVRQDPLRDIDYTEADPRLRNASLRELRNNWHLTQLLRLAGPGLQVFYTFDRRVQASRFADTDWRTDDTLVVTRLLLDSLRTEDRARFRLNQHTAGVLGGARFGSYRLYASRRDARYELYQGGGPVPVGEKDSAILAPRDVGRLAFGGEAQFRVRDVVAVTADGEYQTGDNTYWLRGVARYRWLTVSQLRNGYAPALTENAFYGNHFRWENQFANTQRDESRATLAFGLGRHRLYLDAALDRVRNYIYYSTDSRPHQETTTLTIGTGQARYRAQLGNFHSDLRVGATYRPGRTAAVYRAPDVLGNALFYYEGFVFKRALFGQVGVDLYTQAASRALAWQPGNQQFFLQETVLLPAVPVVDVFLAADIKNVNLFVKLANAAQGVPRGAWYQTPGYPQLRRSFTFGLKWAFFD